MIDLILFGMQGSGKGTQGAILAKKYNYKIFDTGNALRQLASEESRLGEKIKEITTAGQLVPTKVVMEIVAEFLMKTLADQTVIFDGIPRSEDQRVLLEQEFEKVGRKPIAIYTKLTKEEALKRLLGRLICSGCKKIYGAKDRLIEGANCPDCGGKLKVRADDTEEAIRTRLGVYVDQTMPVIEKYREENRLIEIDGTKSVEEVTEKISSKLQN